MEFNRLTPQQAKVADSDGELDTIVMDVFDYHAWSKEQIEQGTAVRVALGAAFKAVLLNVPASADRTVALRKIREARMDANSAITYGGKY